MPEQQNNEKFTVRVSVDQAGTFEIDVSGGDMTPIVAESLANKLAFIATKIRNEARYRAF
ncbi:MAG: hypothetical protein ACKO0Z_16335 [Betaproteobacteria bacterium]